MDPDLRDLDGRVAADADQKARVVELRLEHVHAIAGAADVRVADDPALHALGVAVFDALGEHVLSRVEVFFSGVDDHAVVDAGGLLGLVAVDVGSPGVCRGSLCFEGADVILCHGGVLLWFELGRCGALPASIE